MKKWNHPGGKLRELGAHTLTDEELLAILISTGTKGKAAEEIAHEVFDRYGSFEIIANQSFEKFLDIKGLGKVKGIRMAAAFEIARRVASNEISKGDTQD